MVVIMNYRVEVYDGWGRRVERFDEVPLMDVACTTPDRQDSVRGLLPQSVASLGPGCRVKVWIEDRLFCDARVDLVAPQWSDTRKLILDKYVPFHEVVEFEAHSDKRRLNPYLSRRYTNWTISAMVKDVINHVPGPLHYLIDHEAYPGGAHREHVKFLARKTAENELGEAGVETGQWVGSPRLDASAAYAKDGDTICGLFVDGELWPEVRLMMVDTEETSRNSHAIRRHPEVAHWSDAEYAASAYRRRALAAQQFLQHLIDTHGIDSIELNPHRNAAGAFDDRVDAYGRYVGLVYGQEECFNAALIEQGHSEVYLYDEGRFLPPELQLKDYFSYQGVCRASVQETDAVLSQFNAMGGALELIAGLAYAAGGFVFSADAGGAVQFGAAMPLNRLVFFDSQRMGAQLGSHDHALCNMLIVSGDPMCESPSESFIRSESMDEYGVHAHSLAYFALSVHEDIARLAEGMLDDLAYPEFAGIITFFNGDPDWRVGDLAELRGAPLRRLERALPGEWGGALPGRLAGRVCEVRHRFSGKHVATTVFLTSPLRSVANPASFLVGSQPSAASLFAFRLDDEAVGLDMGFHLN